MKKYILVLMILCFFINSFGLERERKIIIGKEIIIDYIRSSQPVLDEWKNPGLYSPVNMFDGDVSTCFAEGHIQFGIKNLIEIEIEFKNPVYIDEIRIMNGFGKNDTFFKDNNRIKKLLINVPPYRGAEMTLLTLEDKKEFQSFKFDKSYLVRIVNIQNKGRDEVIYKGDKYDDTCITEIEFYHQGKKIPVMNVMEAKKDYLGWIEAHLNTIFLDNNGEYIKYKWKVEDRKLYKYKKGKWLLTKYFNSSDDEVEVFDEDGNCNSVTSVNDHNECSRFNLKKVKR